MRYYSDVLKKIFDTEDELKAAESVEAEKKANKEARAKEIEKLRKEYAAALSKYCKDYGAYTMNCDKDDATLGSLFDVMRDWF